MPNYDELTARLRVRPWTVSGRLLSALTGGFIVGLSLGIPGPNRELKSWLTTILAEPRLNALLDAQTVAPGWTSTLYDRDLNPIVSSNKAAGALTHKPPEVLRKELERVGPKSSAEGLVDAMDELGNPILVAYRRSDSTNWTVALSAPLEQVNAPLTDVARRLLGPGLLLLIVGGAAALFTARQVQRPLSSLSSLVASAQGEVAELSSQLLSLQEEERRRIARELHDSTVQHLVATNLGLTRLDEEIAQRQPRAHLTLKEVSGEVQLALTELRIFTYLLHPPDLASDGLAATLRNFVAGFGRRSELQVNLQIPDIIDEAPPPISLSFCGSCKRRLPMCTVTHARPESISGRVQYEDGSSSESAMTDRGWAATNFRWEPPWEWAFRACTRAFDRSTETSRSRRVRGERQCLRLFPCRPTHESWIESNRRVQLQYRP